MFADVNECARGRHDCVYGLATCTNTEGWYTCDCTPPLVGNGRYCEGNASRHAMWLAVLANWLDINVFLCLSLGTVLLG